MNGHRLRAPATDGALLAVPPLDEVVARFDSGIDPLAGWSYDFQGRPAGRLRFLAHRQVIAAALDFLASNGVEPPTLPCDPGEGGTVPLVVTGHQPELFHPGVWVKNFATAAIARRRGGVGLNLIVDNDLPKSSSVRAPRVEGDLARIVHVEFDSWRGEAPYEDLPVHDEALFASFGDRLRGTLDGSVRDPLIEDFWPRALRRASTKMPLGLRLALARRELEASWGVSNLEVPLSKVCQTEAFLWFASHLLAHVERFQGIHNRALADYRTHYGIRSRNHPVSALGRQGEWIEAPFWVWRTGEPRRHALLVRQGRKTMQLRITGENDLLIEFPLSAERDACCAVERLQELPRMGVRLRTRALTTTMFSRYLLGDLFLHGIGGAKYDELGDVVASRFFGIDPPGFLTLTMTLFPGLPHRPSNLSQLHSIDRALRDVVYNPDRFIHEPIGDDERTLIRARKHAIAQTPQSRSERIARFRSIRHLNEALQPLVRQSLDSFKCERGQILRDLEWNRVSRSRELPFVVHSASRLKAAMDGVMSTISR